MKFKDYLLFSAVEKNNIRKTIRIINLLKPNINAINEERDTPLHIAAKRDDSEMVKILLDNGANVNVKDIFKRTPLHCAAIVDNVATANLLINKGADINYQSSYGLTALHLAATNNSTKVFELLLNKGADYTKVDNDGRYAYDFGSDEEDRSPCQKIFDKFIAKNNSKDNDPKSAPVKDR